MKLDRFNGGRSRNYMMPV